MNGLPRISIERGERGQVISVKIGDYVATPDEAKTWSRLLHQLASGTLYPALPEWERV